MNLNIKSLQSITKHKIIYPIILLLVINIGIIIGLVIIGNTLYQKFLTLKTDRDEISKLKSQIVLVRNNKDVFKGSIDVYTDALANLIPDEESYFSVITALEKLANRTGVTITSYTIDLQSTTEEKLTLTLTINGDPDAINRLLSEYMYIGGRFITNESSTIAVESEEKALSISFNFFHKAFKEAVSPATVITEKDIQFIDEVISKM